MKKSLIIGTMLLGLTTLCGCNTITKPIDNLTDQEKNSAWLDSVNEAVTPKQEEQTQQNLKDDFTMKEKCAKYADSWDKNVKDNRKDYDAYWYCDTSVYYSKYRNSCIGESQCSAGGMNFNRIVDLLENTTLYSDDDINGDIDEFRRLHDLYYN